jgi:hypothetical protein
MLEYYIDDVFCRDKENMIKFQKCSQKEIDLSCFCYHENLSMEIQ